MATKTEKNTYNSDLNKIADMTPQEFIKKHKLPQKDLAAAIVMNYNTFRKKLNIDGYFFTKSEESDLKEAIIKYCEKLNEEIKKNLD